MASSAAKKLDEIKEAISANSTPIKNGMSEYASEDDLHSDNTLGRRRISSEFDVWGRFSESRKSSFNNLVPLGEVSTSNLNLSAYPVLPDCIYPENKDVSIYLWLHEAVQSSFTHFR